MANISHGGDTKSKNRVANSRFDISLKDAAKVWGVSERSISEARRLEKDASDLYDKVMLGAASLTTTKRESRLTRAGAQSTSGRHLH